MPTRYPLVRTKLNPPRVSSGLLVRSRLFERLDQGAELPLTLVSAPAGYGKSSLAASWLDSRSGARAWISLDEGDSELRVFLQYLLAAFGDLPEGESSALLEASELPPVATIASVFVNQLAELEEELTLVFDDFHVIHEPEIHELLSLVLRHPPPRLRLLLLTRADPPLPLTSLRARGQLAEIRAAELQFEPDEAARFLQGFTEKELDPAVLDGVALRTEGWAVGLQLAGLMVRDQEDPETVLAALSAEKGRIGEFMIAEVVEGLDEPERTALLEVAVLERFCAELCDAVLSPSGSRLDGESFLASLQERNLFVRSLDEEGRWFCLHQLFRELLLHQLKRRCSADEIRGLRRRAAGWLEQQGYLDEAFSYLLAAGDIDSAVDFVRRNRFEQMNHERWNLLDLWLHRLPAERVEGELELVLLRAWVNENRFRYRKLLSDLDRLDSLLAESPPGGELRAEVDAIMSTRFYIAGNGERAEAYAHCALDSLPAQRWSQRGYALILRTLALQLLGRPNEARELALTALEDRQHHGTSLHGRILIALCFVNDMEGDTVSLLRDAGELLELGLARSLAESVSFGRYFLGCAHWDRDELDAAASVLEPLARQRVPVQVSNHAHGVYLLARIRSLRGERKEAAGLIAALASEALARQNPELVRLAEFFQADLALREGRDRDAALWTRRIEPQLQGPWWRSQLPELTWIRLEAIHVDPARRTTASEALTTLVERLRSQHHRRLYVEALTLRALFEERQGDPVAAETSLREAVDLARPRVLLRPFLDLGPEMAALLLRLGLRIEGRSLVEAPEIGPPDRAVAQRGEHPDSLTDRELDVLHLLAERLSNKEIGARLFITSATVKRHTINIYQKLQVHGRREAVLRAREMGVLS